MTKMTLTVMLQVTKLFNMKIISNLFLKTIIAVSYTHLTLPTILRV